MARILVYYFALTIFFVACDDYGEYYDTKLLDSGTIKDMAERGDIRGLKKEMATHLATQVSNIRMKIIERSFLTNFDCAFTGLKPVLEDIYKTWCPFAEINNGTEKPIPEIPSDIVNLNSTHDQWFDDYEPKPNPLQVKRNGSRKITRLVIRRTRVNLFKFYKHWYYLITYSNTSAPFIKELREKLSKHKESFPLFYNDTDIFVRFAACVSRGFLLVCTTCHRVMQDLQEYFKAHPRGSFTEKLFELVPYWHLSEETVVYINILRSTLSSVEPESLGKGIRGDIKCFFAQNKKNETVCLPYLYSNECGRVKFNTLLPNDYHYSFVTKSQTTSLTLT